MIGQLVDRIEQRAARFDRTVRGPGGVAMPPSWLAEWSTWLDSWRAQAAGIDWLDRTWGSTATMLQAKERELASWEADYRRRGGVVIGPVIVPAAPASLGVWGKIGIGIASGLAVYAIIALLRPREM